MAVPSKAEGPDPAAAEPDPFEFFSSRSPPPTCAAADVFLAGKILPFVPPPPPPPPPKRAEIPDGAGGLLPSRETSAACEVSHGRRRRFWGSGAKAGYRRLGRASDCHDKLLPPPQPQARRQQQRPRWYLCVLGSVRVPATMDISDIRSRQQRRQSSTAAPAGEPGGGPGDVGRGTWRLLRSLSCTGLESASAVTSPLSFAAHVQTA